jgi:excisionase family DNA binding protein
MEGELYLTVEQVSSRLKVSKMTIYRLISGSRLAAVRVGRSYRISEKSLTAYLNGKGEDGSRSGT